MVIVMNVIMMMVTAVWMVMVMLIGRMIMM